jgi:hypothetical protein
MKFHDVTLKTFKNNQKIPIFSPLVYERLINVLKILFLILILILVLNLNNNMHKYFILIIINLKIK